jgi:hypothetical protein
MTEEQHCPQCGSLLKVLWFLGVQPDGYVCEPCQIWLTDDLQPLAQVIEEGGSA